MKEVDECVGLEHNCGRQKGIIRKISHCMLFSSSGDVLKSSLRKLLPLFPEIPATCGIIRVSTLPDDSVGRGELNFVPSPLLNIRPKSYCL
jgi:hypothetical protein